MSQHFQDEDHVDLQKGWGELFQQLKVYKEEYGDTNVPLNFAPNPKLANWVQYLRWCYRRWGVGKKIPGGLTAEKIANLEDIGFQWRSPAFNIHRRD